MMKHATIRVPGLKVAVSLPADAIPQDLVPMEGPAGEPVIELVLEGGSLTALAKLNGKNYRKLLKTIAEQGRTTSPWSCKGFSPAGRPGRGVCTRGCRVPGQHQNAQAGRASSAMRPGLGSGLSRDGPDTAGEFRSGRQPRKPRRPRRGLRDVPLPVSIRSRLVAATVATYCRCTFALVPCPTQAERPHPGESVPRSRNAVRRADAPPRCR